MSYYEDNDPASLWIAPYERELYNASWENFVECPDTPSTWVLYNRGRKSLSSFIVGSLVLWTMWFMMLIACIWAIVHQYTGILHIALSPVFVCIFGVIFALASAYDAPQTLILTKGAMDFKHIIGLGAFAMHRTVPFQRIGGLSLTFIHQLPKNGGSYISLRVMWLKIGVPVFIGRYIDNDMAAARVKYISERTGLPIINISLQPEKRLGSSRLKNRPMTDLR